MEHFHVIEYMLIEDHRILWEDNGISCEYVTSAAECEFAAQKLGLSDGTVEDDGQNGNTYYPPFCYYLWGNRLKFNRLGTNTGYCSSSEQCLCRQSAMDQDMDCPGIYDPSDRLVRAAILGNMNAMRSLLMCNETDINHTDRDGRTSLYIASYYGRAEVAGVLLSQPKIDVHKGRLTYYGPTVQNESPLYIAATENKPEVVRDVLRPSIFLLCARVRNNPLASWI